MEILGNEPPGRPRSAWFRLPRRAPRGLKVPAVALVLLGLAWITVSDPALNAPAAPAAPSPSVVAVTAPPPRPAPVLPEAGPPPHTGLRLLLGDTLYDVDAGTAHQVRGLPPRRVYTWSAAAGPEAVLLSTDRGADTFADDDVYVLRRGSDRARLLARGAWPKPAPDGAWLWRWYTEKHCELGKVRLDGTRVRPYRRIDCMFDVSEETRLGLIGRRNEPGGPAEADGVLLRPQDLTVTYRAPDPIVVVGGTVYSVKDGVLRSEEPSGVPRSLGRLPVLPREIAPQVKASPDGALLGFVFTTVSPAAPYQSVEVRVYDRRTARWLRMPSTPVSASIKTLQWTWTHDGRIALAADFERRGQRIVVWRPGAEGMTVVRYGPPPEGAYGLVDLTAW
ncbi:hypothetical protein AB0M28_32630 [Streptomyces sp. NPDC051940]|uniref:hypothetical protein n=1 Tax=Streptomyces sp. NPDC051940 TaxID=3155675 RepID=UPI0034310148